MALSGHNIIPYLRTTNTVFNGALWSYGATLVAMRFTSTADLQRDNSGRGGERAPTQTPVCDVKNGH